MVNFFIISAQEYENLSGNRIDTKAKKIRNQMNGSGSDMIIGYLLAAGYHSRKFNFVIVKLAFQLFMKSILVIFPSNINHVIQYG
jgi:hypothetical protein